MTKNVSNIFVLTLILSLLVSSLGKNLQVPKLDSHLEHDMKLGETQYLTEPEYPFKYVYSRSIQQIMNDSTQNFIPCHESPPEFTIRVRDTVDFDGVPAKNPVKYKFEDIKFSQFLLDVYYDYQDDLSTDVYLIFENGVMAYVHISQKYSIQTSQTFKIKDLLPQQKLEVGYFTKIGQRIVFINKDYAISIDNNGGSLLTGYLATEGFETVISIENKYIAAAYREKGVKFYKLQGQNLILSKQILRESFILTKQLQITDMQYYSYKKSLLILDEENGLLSFQIAFASDSINFLKFQIILNRQFCTLMQLNEELNNLHMVCDKIYSISLNQFPIITEKILPHPRIKIRQIYAIGPIVAYVGRSVFKIMYLDRLASYYEDQNIDKLILTKKTFLSANENGIILGTYEMITPSIQCLTFDKQFLGSHKTLLTTKAECSRDYFETNNISTDSLGTFSENDTCIYSIEKNIYFWEPGVIKILPIMITLGVFILIGLIIVAIWAVKKIRFNNIRRELEEYLKVGLESSHNHEMQEKNQGKSQDYQKFEEEIQNNGRYDENKDNKNRSNVSNLQDEEEQNKPQQNAFDIQ